MLNVKSIARQLQKNLRAMARQQAWQETWLESLGVVQSDEDINGLSACAASVFHHIKASVLIASLNLYFFIVDSGATILSVLLIFVTVRHKSWVGTKKN